MTKAELANSIYETIIVAAATIAKIDEFYGKCAQRKVSAISATSSLETLIKVGKDIELITSLIAANS